MPIFFGCHVHACTWYVTINGRSIVYTTRSIQCLYCLWTHRLVKRRCPRLTVHTSKHFFLTLEWLYILSREGWRYRSCFIFVSLDISLWDLHANMVYTSEHFSLTPPIVNGSTELRRVEVATVLGMEEDHAFQYFPGENDSTVWQGSYREDEIRF